MKQVLFGFCLMFFISAVQAQEVNKMNWLDTQYPDYITKITDFRERADWSHDGKRILFVERSFGDVYEYNLESKSCAKQPARSDKRYGNRATEFYPR